MIKANAVHHWQHVVGLAIREGIPFERVQIDTSLQLVAASIHAPIQVTVVSVYIPPSVLIEQLEGPTLLMGDFNAHHLAGLLLRRPWINSW